MAAALTLIIHAALATRDASGAIGSLRSAGVLGAMTRSGNGSTTMSWSWERQFEMFTTGGSSQTHATLAVDTALSSSGAPRRHLRSDVLNP